MLAKFLSIRESAVAVSGRKGLSAEISSRLSYKLYHGYGKMIQMWHHLSVPNACINSIKKSRPRRTPEREIFNHVFDAVDLLLMEDGNLNQFFCTVYL